MPLFRWFTLSASVGGLLFARLRRQRSAVALLDLFGASALRWRDGVPRGHREF